MSYLQITILSIIQGLTEFLPVSSSGHLVLAPKLLGFDDPGLAVDAFLHLGTLLAVMIYFREEIWFMFLSLKASPKTSSPKISQFIGKGYTHTIYKKLAIGILLASVPAIFVGLNFKSFFESDYIRSIDCIIYTLIAGSLLMLVAEKFFSKERNIAALTKKEMFFIGCMQCLALFPGISRSGSTIAGALFLGLKKDEAARFSFLLGLPVVAGAGALAVKDLLTGASSMDFDILLLAWGFFLSFVSGYFAIDFLLKFLQTQSLTCFVIYRVLLALVLAKLVA